MRFKSEKVEGIAIYAVAGVNTVSFGFDVSKKARKKLLGFAVERIDTAGHERYYMRGFKVFPSVVPNPDANTSVSTFEHPIQSLVWDDFTAAAGHTYTYVFHPLKGSPKNLDRSTPPVSIKVATEPLYGKTHDIFFNRGVASSQAYAREFHNLSPDEQPTAALRTDALAWLSRDLDDAIIKFIRSAQPGDALRGCFYEFTYLPVLQEFSAAINRGVDVKLIVDCKVNEHTDREKQPNGTTKPVFHPSFPRLENLEAIGTSHLPTASIKHREARRSSIAHNKFIVLIRGQKSLPAEVWTGSTNLTNGGFHGQANVGHWVKDVSTAQRYLDYWTLLSGDPGGKSTDTKAAVLDKNKTFREAVATLSTSPASRDAISVGITPIFSPRAAITPLELYASLVDSSKQLACVTFAFSISDEFKNLIADNTPKGPLCFLLLESEDKPSANSTKPFVRLNSKNNVYEAWGSEIDTPLGQWVVETDNRSLQLNTHVVYVHCKFLLSDPLSADPIVVTGSANFSTASTKENDENMLIIRGDLSTADIYFTEFNRLFNHYYFRSVVERTARKSWPGKKSTKPFEDGTLNLVEDATWLDKYQPGTLKSKRVAQFVDMAGIK
jgi:phosphatidylserine/phosphatidylglycerophosphate/cardiolipin synthase-like enzyme